MSVGGFGGGQGGVRGGRGRNNLEAEQFRKLYVAGFSKETTADRLRSHFSQWGEVVDCFVIKDPVTKNSKGCGFVFFKESVVLDEVQKHRPHHIDGRDLDTKRAILSDDDPRARQRVTRMYIGGIKDNTTEQHIREAFEAYGTIKQVELLTDKCTGKIRPFCYITYEDHDSVDKCVLMKRTVCNGRKVQMKKANPKDQMGGSGGGRGGGRGGRGGGAGNYTNRGGYAKGGGYDDYGGFGGEQNWDHGGGYGDYDNDCGFGQNYGGGYGGGPMYGDGYSARGNGPLGGGYGVRGGFRG